MQDHDKLASAIARQHAQASLPMSLPWLAFIAEKCSESYRPPVSCRARKRRKIAQFANHLRRRECAQRWLTDIQCVSNMLLRVSCRLRSFGAAWRVKLPEAVGCLRLTTGEPSYFRLSVSEPIIWRCHSDESTHDRACAFGI